MIRERLYAWTGRLPVRIFYAEEHTGATRRTPLFERYYLGTSGRWTYYVHHYLRSDPDRGLHDHPYMASWALPLAGGYVEQRGAGFSRLGVPLARRIPRPAGVPYRLPGTAFHSLELEPGVTSWSLFAHTPSAKGWGFLRALRGAGPVAPGVPTTAYVPATDQRVTDEAAKWARRPLGRDVDRAAP